MMLGSSIIFDDMTDVKLFVDKTSEITVATVSMCLSEGVQLEARCLVRPLVILETSSLQRRLER